jgi:hypothetical protein
VDKIRAALPKKHTKKVRYPLASLQPMRVGQEIVINQIANVVVVTLLLTLNMVSLSKHSSVSPHLPFL